MPSRAIQACILKKKGAKDTGPYKGTKTTMDPDQQKLYGQNMQALRGEGGPLNDLYKFNAQQAGDVFDQTVARPAYRGFQENIIPGITGQFRSNNIQNSSYTGEALSRAGRDVQENLNAQRASTMYQGQNAADERRFKGVQGALDMSNFAYPNTQQERTPSAVDQIIGKAAPIAGDWLGGWLSNKVGGSSSSPFSNSVANGAFGYANSFMPR